MGGILEIYRRRCLPRLACFVQGFSLCCSVLDCFPLYKAMLVISSLSHVMSALGHLREFGDPKMCFEKSQKPNCLLLTHVTLHKKGSWGKVK